MNFADYLTQKLPAVEAEIMRGLPAAPAATPASNATPAAPAAPVYLRHPRARSSVPGQRAGSRAYPLNQRLGCS